MRETTAAPIPDVDASDDSWREKYKRWYLQLRGLAWESMMLDKTMRQNKIVRDIAQRTANGTIGKDESGAASEDDEMAITIGDRVIHHHHYPAEPQPAKENKVANESPISGISPLVKNSLLGAALVAGGAAIAGTTYYLAKPDTNPPAVVKSPAESQQRLNPGGLKIEVVKDPEI